MEKTSASTPLQEAIERYKQDLMAAYRRQQETAAPADTVLPEETPAQQAAAASPIPDEVPAGEAAAVIPAQEAEEPATRETIECEAQAMPITGSLPEGQGREITASPPADSGTPTDAIGRNEAEYRTSAQDTLTEILGQRTRPTPAALPSHSTTDVNEFQQESTAKEKYEAYCREYPDTGTVKVQIFTAKRTFPVQGAQVNLYKQFPGGSYLISSQFSDQSGQVLPVTVPARDRGNSNAPGGEAALDYVITVTHPDYVNVIIEHVPVYDGVVSLQAVDLVPTAAAPDGSGRYTEYPAEQPTQGTAKEG